MRFFLIALLAILAGCLGPPEDREASNQPDYTPAFHATSVNYAASVEELASDANVSLREAPSLASIGGMRRTTAEIPIGIVPTDSFDRDDGYEAASLHEALAFVRQHPDVFSGRIGVCARGTVLVGEDGVPAFPVMSRRRGQLTAGVWTYTPCEWDVVVARQTSQVTARQLARTGG